MVAAFYATLKTKFNPALLVSCGAIAGLIGHL